ncbi:MAG: acyltransferase [Oligoflexia bacterium]|nr:acyltransferase [Oligoflexia bacterium]
MVLLRFVNFVTTGVRELIKVPRDRIAALDGLRAAAILLVLAAHSGMFFYEVGGAESALAQLPFVRGGWVGVDLFFVLSGFLIGRQLWSELDRTGSLRIGRFLVKRGLRIWPLYFTVLATAWALGIPRTGAGEQAWPELVFLSNYLGEYLLQGSWSLATEEQFYLVMPILLWLATRVTRDPRMLRAGLLALFLLAPAIRAWTAISAGKLGVFDQDFEIYRLYVPFHTHFDALVAGVFLARLDFRARMRWPWLPLGLALFTAPLLRWLEPLLFKYTGLALVFGAATWHCLARPRGGLARCLAWKGFHLIAKLSFGMYLTHRLLLERLRAPIRDQVGQLPPEAGFALIFALALAGSLLLAAAGFVLVERPCLRLRDRRLRDLAPRRKRSEARPAARGLAA